MGPTAAIQAIVGTDVAGYLAQDEVILHGRLGSGLIDHSQKMTTAAMHMAASTTFALKAGVWFRRGRLLIVSPDSQGTACPLSGRNSTYRLMQISGTSSYGLKDAKLGLK